MKIKIRLLKETGYFLIFLLAAAFLFFGATFTTESVFALNISNVTVTARVNVTNTEPTLYLVTIFPNPIDLTANTATTVICNGSVTDANGFTDIKNVSATLYDISVGSVAADDNNNHYTNISCGNCTAIPGSNNQNGSCVCQFAVQYYANPATWQCNMTVNDSGSLTSTLNSSFVTLNEVLGISIENNVLDYGNMSASQISPPTRENVTSTGNIPINVTVRGYGGGNESIGMNLTMICESGTNITFGNQRYYPNNETAFIDMLNLTNRTTRITNLTLQQRTNDFSFGNSSNSTYWRLQIPIGSAGVCNGTIIFGAIDATLT